MGILGSFLGISQGNDLQKGYKQATQMRQQGYEQALPLFDQAQQRLDPYASSGLAANRLYAAALGLDGREAQQAFYRDYTETPDLGGQYEAARRALNARGYGDSRYGDSGAGYLANARIFNEGVQTHLNRLQQAAGQGLQVAGQQGGIDLEKGNFIYGKAQQDANARSDYAAARAASRTTGINNLLGLGGLAVSAYGAYRGAPPLPRR